tara:strand:+ start:2075 stop:2974 length:900 start_codon:yes stop_codon:yes gene_type:complete
MKVKPINYKPLQSGDPCKLEPGQALDCALTIDVEDWYQSCVDLNAKISERVVKNVDTILSLLNKNCVKATFFVQGKVLESFPKIGQVLISEGHEVQSHGYSHQSLLKMNQKELEREIEFSKKTVEDACGVKVTSFRAPDFSINETNFWVLDKIAEAGFTLDSSIFPIRMRRYGIAGWETRPHKIEFTGGNSIIEVPVAIWAKNKIKIPVGGGGYFRLMPLNWIQRMINSITTNGQPVIIYCHPYEFNKKELMEYKGRSPEIFRVTQGWGRSRFSWKIQEILSRFSFGRLDHLLKSRNIL